MSIAVVGILLVAACGGDDDANGTGAAESDSGSTPATGSAEGDTPAAGGDSASAPAAGADRAVIQIGDERWEFDLSGAFATCIALGGALGAVGATADGEVTANIDLPPENWESLPASAGWQAPMMRVDDDANERDWRAGGDVTEQLLVAAGLDAGVATVESFSTDGAQASGTAAFIDTNALQLAAATGGTLPEPVSGSFEVSCG